jgi:hypothetical protein
LDRLNVEIGAEVFTDVEVGEDVAVGRFLFLCFFAMDNRVT